MRIVPVLALVVSTALAVPATAGAQADGDTQRMRDAADGVPLELWEPSRSQVQQPRPGVVSDGGDGAPLVLALLLLAAAGGAGYLIAQSPSPRRVRLAPAVPAAPVPVAAPAPAALPEVREPEPPPAPPAEEVSMETCNVALSHAWGRGCFEVRIKDKGGVQRVVARSTGFEVRRGRVMQEEGRAALAHRDLMLRLEAAGWRDEPADEGPWYERRLSRPLEPGSRGLDRVLVSARPRRDEAEFVALALDDYGNGRVLARSPRFARTAGAPVEDSEPAVAAHGTLVADLEAHGWRRSGTLESWYGATLARRRL